MQQTKARSFHPLAWWVHTTLVATLFLFVTTVLLATKTVSAYALIPVDRGNDCTHPYWRDTLRCQALAKLGSDESPQPNLNDSPQSADAIRDYTRVFLSSSKIRCADGTRPVIYVAPALCDSPAGCLQPSGTIAKLGEPSFSDRWMISVTGGGACQARDLDGDGLFEDGSACAVQYGSSPGEMSTAFDPPMKYLGNTPGKSGGIASRDNDNPFFTTFNHVRVEKCSNDRFNGNASHKNVSAEISGEPVSFTLYSHGQLIMHETLRELAKGLRYTTWIDNQGVVEEVRAHLPRLGTARQVLFVGHSGGAHGLMHNIDWLADFVRQRVGPSVDVRAVLDANFLPSIENEAAFATDPTGAPLGGDAYTDQWEGGSVADGAAFTYDGKEWVTESWFAEQYDAWDTRFDSSCLAAHTPETQWKCRDRYHVLFNHITTPIFLREDFSDPNKEHTANGTGHPVQWALPPGCTYPDLLELPGCTPPDFEVTTEHRQRLIRQAQTLLSDISVRSELATGADTSLFGGHVPTVFVWMPNCNSHEGVYRDTSFFDTALEPQRGLDYNT